MKSISTSILFVCLHLIVGCSCVNNVMNKSENYNLTIDLGISNAGSQTLSSAKVQFGDKLFTAGTVPASGNALGLFFAEKMSQKATVYYTVEGTSDEQIKYVQVPFLPKGTQGRVVMRFDVNPDDNTVVPSLLRYVRVDGLMKLLPLK